MSACRAGGLRSAVPAFSSPTAAFRRAVATRDQARRSRARTAPGVKLYSRPGNDLTKRFPLIVDALARLHGITVKKSLRAAERKRADVVRARRRWIREQRFAHM